MAVQMSVPFALEENEELASRIASMCAHLSLSTQVREHAMRFMRAMQAQASSPEENGDALVAACCVYFALWNVVSQRGAKVVRGDVWLQQVLKATRVPMKQFLEAVGKLSKIFKTSEDFTTSLQLLKQQYVVLVIIYTKFRKLWERCWEQKDPAEVIDQAMTERFCWYLFLWFKEKHKITDLLESFNLLLATFEFVVRYSSATSGFRATLLTESAEIDAATTSQTLSTGAMPATSMEMDAINALHMIAQQELAAPIAGASTSLLDAMPRAAQCRLDIVTLKKYSSSLHQEVAAVMSQGKLVLQVTSRGNLYADMMHPACVAANGETFSTLYETLVRPTIDSIDERIAVDPGFHDMLGINVDESTETNDAPHTPSQAAAGREHDPAAPRLVESSARKLFQDFESNLENVPTMTSAFVEPATPAGKLAAAACANDSPFSPTRSTTSGKRSRTMSPVDVPSEGLQEYFTAVSNPDDQPTLSEIVSERVATLAANVRYSTYPKLAKQILPDMGVLNTIHGFSSSTSTDDTLSRTRRVAVGLFYAALEAILDRETSRLRSRQHYGLLASEMFHRCLLACSFEVILKARSIVTLAFPETLHFFEITPFDYHKVLETFVRAVPDLPHGLKHHLMDIEVAIVLQHVWAKTSPLLEMINTARSTGHWPPNPLASDTDNDMLKIHDIRGKENQPSASATTQNSASRSQLLAMDQLFRRFVLIVANRISRLCSELQISGDAIDQIWTVCKYLVTDQPNMLRGRHVDQIVLCAIYGVMKVRRKDEPLSFKSIIDKYRAMLLDSDPTATRSHPPQAPPFTSDVVRDVDCGKGNKGDIIKFYNAVFIPAAKSIILQFQHSDEQQQAVDAVHSTQEAESIARDILRNGEPPASPSIADREQPAPFTPPHRNGLRHAHPGSGCSTGSGSHQFVSVLPSTPSSSMIRVDQQSNVFIKSPSYAQHQQGTTARTRARWAFGESPARDLELINRAVNKDEGRSTRSASVMRDPQLGGGGDAKRLRKA